GGVDVDEEDVDPHLLRVLQRDDRDQGDQDADRPGAPVRLVVLPVHPRRTITPRAGAQLLLTGMLTSGFDVGVVLPPRGSVVTITMSTPFMSSITAAATPSEFGAKRTSADSTVLPRWTQACRTLSGGS